MASNSACPRARESASGCNSATNGPTSTRTGSVNRSGAFWRSAAKLFRSSGKFAPGGRSNGGAIGTELGKRRSRPQAPVGARPAPGPRGADSSRLPPDRPRGTDGARETAAGTGGCAGRTDPPPAVPPRRGAQGTTQVSTSAEGPGTTADAERRRQQQRLAELQPDTAHVGRSLQSEDDREALRVPIFVGPVRRSRSSTRVSGTAPGVRACPRRSAPGPRTAG